MKAHIFLIIQKLAAKHILHKGIWRNIYRRIFKPTSADWGKYLGRWGGFKHVGRDVEINFDCNVTDPALVCIGNNVTLSDCNLIGHDPVIHVLCNRFGKALDSAGPINIRDNCFIGHGAIIMPHVTIGPDSIVAAGSVITTDVAAGTVVGGNPAKVICTTQDLADRLEKRSETYPWIDLIRGRELSFDPQIESLLIEKRVKFFFN